MLHAHPIPAFDDNYIWALHGHTQDQIVVVDPGDAEAVTGYLRTHNAQLAAILVTHHHWDHTGGVEALRERFNIPVYGPADSPFSGITDPLEDGNEINILDNRLQIRAVPGHTLDHIAYYQPDQRPQLFCGDTLFLAGCGRLFEGTPQQMQTAMDYFASLPDETEVYCTHEYSIANLRFAQAVEPQNPAITRALEMCTERRQENRPTLPSTIGAERQYNPYMRTREGSVKAAAEHRTGRALSNEIEVLAAVREWKNQF
ncbi:MAG TPA: hydroxyacylglutathione hydrolase [Marinobacterium sp.]|nr:hydroxyacylglutathione hydrolase [Marinobacterium sp.]